MQFTDRLTVLLVNCTIIMMTSDVSLMYIYVYEMLNLGRLLSHKDNEKYTVQSKCLYKETVYYIVMETLFLYLHN